MAKYKIIPSSRTIVQSPISIGHKAEKGIEAIEFDLTAWVETYGSGTLTVIMRRWGDAIPYPIALEIDENNKATWTLSDTDTAKAGMAYAQLSYIVGETVVKKSDIYTFRVMDSLTGEGEPPEAYESWLEHLTHLAAEAMAEVLDIEGIATDKTLSIDGGIADAKATGEALAGKVDAADYSTLSARVGANTIALAEKADRSNTYTKAQVDGLIEDVTVETDTTLTISGAPADAKKVGDELSEIKADLGNLSNLETESKTDLVSAINEAAQSGGAGLSSAAKAALLACFRHVSFLDDDEDYYGNLELALHDVVDLNVVFTQGTNVITKTDKLDDLRNFLTVTATYDNGITAEVSEYTLSGSLSLATSVITVEFGGKKAKFNVSVKALPSGYTEKNYVTTNKSQYISTNIAETAVADCGFRVKVSAPEYDDRGGHLFSATNVQASNLWYYQPSNLKNLSGNHKGTTTRTNDTGAGKTWQTNTIYTIESFLKGGDGVYLNGEKAFDLAKGSTADSTNKICIFAAGQAPTTERYRNKGNTYYIKVFNADMTKKYDFVPCVNSNNVVGLYDLVNNQFYAPTAGTLVAG